MLRLVLSGEMVEHHGRFFDFGRLRMSPAPSQVPPIFVGGHSHAALNRAARVADGWSSAMMTLEQLRETINTLHELRSYHGRAEQPFEIQGVCVDRAGLSGYREQADIGVTDAITVPWLFDGHDFHTDLTTKKDSIKRFGENVIAQF